MFQTSGHGQRNSLGSEFVFRLTVLSLTPLGWLEWRKVVVLPVPCVRRLQLDAANAAACVASKTDQRAPEPVDVGGDGVLDEGRQFDPGAALSCLEFAELL